MNPGLDKITIKGLIVKSINYNLLKSCSNASISYGDRSSYSTVYMDRDKSVSAIKIEDNEKFLDLKLGVKTLPQGGRIPYCYLTLCVKFRDGNNIISLSAEEYRNYIDCVLQYIDDRYGIDVRVGSTTKYDYMEIAYTIPMRITQVSFLNMGSLMMSFLSKRFKEEKSVYSHSKTHLDDIIKKETGARYPKDFSRGNDSVSYVIYLKSGTDFWEKYHAEPESHLIRFELRLKTAAKIKSVFGTNLLSEIDDGMIVSAFCDFHKSMQGKWEEWQISTQKEIQSIIKQARIDHPYNWMHFVISSFDGLADKKGLPIVIDINQIISALPSNRNLSRNKSKIIKSLNDQIIKKQHQYWFSGDIKMIQSVFDSLELINRNNHPRSSRTSTPKNP